MNWINSVDLSTTPKVFEFNLLKKSISNVWVHCSFSLIVEKKKRTWDAFPATFAKVKIQYKDNLQYFTLPPAAHFCRLWKWEGGNDSVASALFLLLNLHPPDHDSFNTLTCWQWFWRAVRTSAAGGFHPTSAFVIITASVFSQVCWLSASIQKLLNGCWTARL